MTPSSRTSPRKRRPAAHVRHTCTNPCVCVCACSSNSGNYDFRYDVRFCPLPMHHTMPCSPRVVLVCADPEGVRLMRIKHMPSLPVHVFLAGGLPHLSTFNACFCSLRPRRSVRSAMQHEIGFYALAQVCAPSQAQPNSQKSDHNLVVCRKRALGLTKPSRRPRPACRATA